MNTVAAYDSLKSRVKANDELVAKHFRNCARCAARFHCSVIDCLVATSQQLDKLMERIEQIHESCEDDHCPICQVKENE